MKEIAGVVLFVAACAITNGAIAFGVAWLIGWSLGWPTP